MLEGVEFDLGDDVLCGLVEVGEDGFEGVGCEDHLGYVVCGLLFLQNIQFFIKLIGKRLLILKLLLFLVLISEKCLVLRLPFEIRLQFLRWVIAEFL